MWLQLRQVNVDSTCTTKNRTGVSNETMVDVCCVEGVCAREREQRGERSRKDVLFNKGYPQPNESRLAADCAKKSKVL